MIVQIQRVRRVGAVEPTMQRRDAAQAGAVSGQIGQHRTCLHGHQRALRSAGNAGAVDLGAFHVLCAVAGLLHLHQAIEIGQPERADLPFGFRGQSNKAHRRIVGDALFLLLAVRFSAAAQSGGKGACVDAGTVVRAAFITIDNRL